LTNNGVAISDDYSYYKLFKTPRPNAPQSVGAIEEIDVGTNRYFAVLGESGRVYSYDFPNGAWAQPSTALAGASTFVTRSPSGDAGLFVVKTDGTIVPYDLAGGRFGAPLRDKWTTDTRAFAVLGAELVRLTSDGRVVDAKTGAPAEAFGRSQVTDLVNVPLYDAYEVAH
jgi:hypothetical protein